jgi:hypothetical protein
LDTPKTLPDFFQHAINVLFAFVIISSFDIATHLFVPLSNLLEYVNFERSLALIFVYFFIITGWIGYFKSITHKEHTETKLGIARFGLDLIIVYLYYYLVTLVVNNNYGDIFNWGLPTIVGLYVLWDILKWFEYRNDLNSETEKASRINRTLITAILLAGVLIQSYIHYYIISIIPSLLFGKIIVWEFMFIVTSIVMVLLYRRRKWLVRSESVI